MKFPFRRDVPQPQPEVPRPPLQEILTSDFQRFLHDCEAENPGSVPWETDLTQPASDAMQAYHQRFEQQRAVSKDVVKTLAEQMTGLAGKDINKDTKLPSQLPVLTRVSDFRDKVLEASFDVNHELPDDFFTRMDSRLRGFFIYDDEDTLVQEVRTETEEAKKRVTQTRQALEDFQKDAGLQNLQVSDPTKVDDKLRDVQTKATSFNFPPEVDGDPDLKQLCEDARTKVVDTVTTLIADPTRPDRLHELTTVRDTDVRAHTKEKLGKYEKGFDLVGEAIDTQLVHTDTVSSRFQQLENDIRQQAISDPAGFDQLSANVSRYQSAQEKVSQLREEAARHFGNDVEQGFQAQVQFSQALETYSQGRGRFGQWTLFKRVFNRDFRAAEQLVTARYQQARQGVPGGRGLRNHIAELRNRLQIPGQIRSAQTDLSAFGSELTHYAPQVRELGEALGTAIQDKMVASIAGASKLENLDSITNRLSSPADRSFITESGSFNLADMSDLVDQRAFELLRARIVDALPDGANKNNLETVMRVLDGVLQRPGGIGMVQGEYLLRACIDQMRDVQLEMESAGNYEAANILRMLRSTYQNRLNP